MLWRLFRELLSSLIWKSNARNFIYLIIISQIIYNQPYVWAIIENKIKKFIQNNHINTNGVYKMPYVVSLLFCLFISEWGEGVWCFTTLSTISQLFRGGQFYWRSTRWKPPTCHKSLTNFITYCCIECTSPRTVL